MDIPYSAILKIALGNDRHAIKDLSLKTESQGHPVSMRNIQRYKAGTMIPSLDTAIWLLQLLNFEISQDEVMESLKIGKDQKVPLTRKAPSQLNVSIPLKNFASELYDEQTIDLLIQQRSLEVTGDSKNIAKYIENLIKKDLSLDAFK